MIQLYNINLIDKITSAIIMQEDHNLIDNLRLFPFFADRWAYNYDFLSIILNLCLNPESTRIRKKAFETQVPDQTLMKMILEFWRFWILEIWILEILGDLDFGNWRF